MQKKRRVLVLIDGYNMYHGISDVCFRAAQNANHLKWVDLRRLMLGFTSKPHHILVDVIYFTAYAYWQPDALARHNVYVRALVNSGVKVVLGRFKKKSKKCKQCSTRTFSYEEKETDVNIAVEMIDAAHKNLFDDLYIVSGDTDLVSTIQRIKTDFPEKRIKVFAPPLRGNYEMRRVGHRFREIEPRHLADALFPARIETKSGSDIIRPPDYAPPDNRNISI